MSFYRDKINVALLGLYPPPYGGCSIHIQRLKRELEDNGMSCCVYDTSHIFKEESNVIGVKSIKLWALNYLLHKKKSIIHCHVYSHTMLFIFSLLASIKRNRIIFTIHSFREELNDYNVWRCIIFWLAKRTGIYFIVVSSEIQAKLIALGIKSSYIEVIPAYINPVIEEDEIAEIPKCIYEFIEQHKPIISANAFKITFYKDQDLYGIDMCIDLCTKLKKYYPQLGFICSLPEIGDHDYFHYLKQMLTIKKLENSFVFITGQYQFYPILMKSDVFVRPTSTDGYAISVAEAIHLKVPAVASDVALRAKGTIVFKNRDINEFALKVKDVLDNYEQHKNRLKNIELENFVGKIIAIYKKLKSYGRDKSKLEMQVLPVWSNKKFQDSKKSA